MLLKRLTLGVEDIIKGISKYQIWFYLSWQDIKLRYRRSVIGPFWITISTGILVLAMGPLYGALLKQEIGPYLQHLSVSMIIWSFISGYINESCTAFIGAEGFIKEVKQPLTIHLLRVFSRNVLFLLHNTVIIIGVLAFFPPEDPIMLLQIPIGLLLLIGNLFWMGLFLATICARFRDIPQLVSNLLQMMFFVSPIIWKVDMLGRNRLAADVNPLYHLMELIRTPILGGQVGSLTWLVAFGLLAGGLTMTLLLFSRFRARVPYWL